MPIARGLYYETHGAPDALPLILSSGLGGSAGYWTPNIPALAEHFYVIAYDHRGTGRSDRVLPHIVTVEDFAADIFALMDTLEIPQASIVGHAAGAVAGLTCALHAPTRVRRLVSVNGWAKADPHFLRCFEARLNLLRGAGVDAFLRAQPIFLYPANWISEHTAELDAELPSQRAHFPGVETMEKRIAALGAFDIADRLSEIKTVQVLVYATRDDMLVPSRASEAMMEDLPQPFDGLWDYGGHACNITDPDTFNREIINFLRS